MRKLLASILLATGLLALADVAEAQCGNVSIAEMNWASAGVAAHVDKLILEKGYGCTVTLVPGDTIPTFASMNEKGEPDVAPEFWVNSVRTALGTALAEGRLIQMAPLLSEGGVEGWWIPKFLADSHREIKTVADALKHPELFPDPKNPARGAIYNCPSGWSCHVSTANLFKATEAEKAGFDLIDPGSAAGLDASIANAFEEKTGWLGYYWAPTAVLGKYDMVKLSFGLEHDTAEWDNCTSVPDCPAPRINPYPTSDAFTIVTSAFPKKAAVAMDYMGKRQWDNRTVGKVLAWMDENLGTNEAGAKYFLETYPEVWTAWVSPEVAEKVKAAL
ncbi:glycine betaine ABC transporter substrate-binding protein [Sinorhizobium sp. BG8]|uniref:glycine betaine ABC transporter substrate-binding protein n=1 Tax=Sinorhizobium sp. BG8 TaxID=2613773 RepID=UPI00193E2FDF|nr:glycine betaine ABC transporter substrate-binding protein [Sinorhizobium sp. BG8]QRM55798.1 ABC transporter substrate-binding protein [Sinorhizobium sp. BG8]